MELYDILGPVIAPMKVMTTTTGQQKPLHDPEFFYGNVRIKNPINRFNRVLIVKPSTPGEENPVEIELKDFFKQGG
jgi:hypothetical protein